MRSLLPVLAPGILAVIVSACAGLTPPTPEQEQKALRMYPGMTTAQLFEGKRLYHSKCGACHSLHAPGSQTAAQWDASLADMQTKVRLSPGESDLIRRYLHIAAKEK